MSFPCISGYTLTFLHRFVRQLLGSNFGFTVLHSNLLTSSMPTSSITNTRPRPSMASPLRDPDLMNPSSFPPLSRERSSGATSYFTADDVYLSVQLDFSHNLFLYKCADFEHIHFDSPSSFGGTTCQAQQRKSLFSFPAHRYLFDSLRPSLNSTIHVGFILPVWKMSMTAASFALRFFLFLFPMYSVFPF